MDGVFENLDYLEELAKAYEKDPTSLDPSWKDFFEEREQHKDIPPAAIFKDGSKDVLIYHLIEAYRTYGHLLADINPVRVEPLPEVEPLTLKALGFTEDDLSKNFKTHGILPSSEAPLQEIIETLKATYCDKIGFEFKGIQNVIIEKWIQTTIEKTQGRPNLSAEEKNDLLTQLSKSELFESFLHTKFVGQKRFSLEGSETLIPMLSTITERGSLMGVDECVIGMPHRGRLNVLVNILGKSTANVFHEFEDSITEDSHIGTGDVKYHKGYSSDVLLQCGKMMHISVAANPSHLESVNPVVEGKTRAKQLLKNDHERVKIIPILIHGDAALAGQGVVYETMQFANLSGFKTGGTIHIVVNNQIGFTTVPKDYMSTHYCTDIAKAFGAPVFHVNAEDPEGCIFVSYLALLLREQFHVDVFIDLNCYRKHGHNETDEPAFTQPSEYQLIKSKKSIRELYFENLVKEGATSEELASALESEFKEKLQSELEQIKKEKDASDKKKWKQNLEGQEQVPKGFFDPVITSVDLQTLKTLSSKFCTIPPNFHPHKKIEQLASERLQMVQSNVDEKTIDWGMAEELAFATLLWEKKHVRLAGQDSRRGTFSHRHSLWMDQLENTKYFPLSHLGPDQGVFDVYNSPLSEFASLGFEYGYSLGYLDALVIWEAQFGDFSNGAQVIIDQYIVTAEQKWNKPSRITLLLPHGYEGQGPEHSSGRMERFLQLAGDGNIQVVNPSTPAQFFHLLRRQVYRKNAKPLIAFTPKGLLRHKSCLSSLSEFTSGQFEEVLDDPSNPKNPQKLLLCSGHIYYDLIRERSERGQDDTILILRLEQLYPIHIEKVAALIEKYKKINACFWVQEEPRNMGGWHYVKSLLQQILGSSKQLKYIGRRQRASPAVGSHAAHQHEYTLIMNEVFAP